MISVFLQHRRQRDNTMSQQQQSEMYNDYKSNLNSVGNTAMALKNRDKLSKSEQAIQNYAAQRANAMDKYINNDNARLKNVLDDAGMNPVTAAKDFVDNQIDFVKTGGVFGKHGQEFASNLIEGAKEKYNDLMDNIKAAPGVIKDAVAKEIQDAPITDMAKKAAEGMKNGAEKIKDLSDKGELGDAIKSLPGQAKDKIKDLPGMAKEGLQNTVGSAKEGIGKLKSSSADTLNKIKSKGVKGNLNDLAKLNLNSFKKGASLAGDLGLPGTDAVGATMDAAKNMKSAGKAAKAVMKGANPAAAVAMVAKDFFMDLVKDPKKALRKILVCCGCICAACFQVIGILLLPIIMLLAMFFSFLSNDSSKHDGPRAADSWIYKYGHADYKDILKDKVSADKENTYIVSHNASLQEGKKEEDRLAEDSDEMKETADYTDEVIYMYKEASTESEKTVLPFRYGEAVVAHVEEGESKPSEVNGFLPIEIEESDTGRGPEDYMNQEGDGLDNPNLNQVVKNVYYIEKRFVYKQERPDVRMEYTMRDEYQVMSMALRKALLRKQSESLEEGNKQIDKEAKNYEEDITEGDIVNGDKYKLVDASIVRDENGNIIEDLSEVTDPERDTYDAAGSRAALSASASSQAVMSQDVATILSGYAASKADSLPEEGYYEMLDKTMSKYLEDSLSLEDEGLEETKMSRPLSEKKTVPYQVMKLDGISGKIIARYNANTMRGMGLTRYKPITASNFFLHPKSKKGGYNAKSYSDVYLKQDLQKGSGRAYVESETGTYVFLSVREYREIFDATFQEARSKAESFDNVGKMEDITVVGDDKTDVSYDYTQFRSMLSITPLDANKIVWEFFDKDEDGYYPMVHDSEISVKDVDGNDVDIPSIPDEEWESKLATVRKLPYYQQQLCYIFDNDETTMKELGYIQGDNPLAGYANEPKYIYYKIVKGEPRNDLERMTQGDFKGNIGDEDVGEIEVDNDIVTNWRREVVENYSTSKTENSAGIEATQSKLLWFIPTGYKQEYRRSSEPEMITKERLDENGEYIRKFSQGSGIAGQGGFIAAGDAVVPVQGWQNKITSKFGPRWEEFHYGLDIGVPVGTSIYAVMDGTVIDVKHKGRNHGAGKLVILKHDNGLTTKYFHLSEPLVKKGDSVLAGQEIAKSGNTGRTTGPHLHFQIELNGKAFDPLPWLKSQTTVSTGGINDDVKVGEDDEDKTEDTTDTSTETDNTTDTANPDGSPEENQDIDEKANREQVVSSVGNKMDYWYDNIMQLFDDEDALNVNTNGGQAVVDVAMSYLGNAGGVYFKNAYKGTPGDTTTQELTPGNTFNWCAAFVSVVMKEAGYPGYTGHGGMIYPGTSNTTSKEEALAPWSFGCDTFAQFAREKGQLQPGDGSYKPKPGDLILYKNTRQGSSEFGHIGIVVSSDDKGVQTVEGNTTGPGAGTSVENGDWKGCVNTHQNIRYSNDISFINVPYPDNASMENVLAGYAATAIGGSDSRVDSYGRIGLGLWHGEKARHLLNEIKNVHNSEVEAIIAESQFGAELTSYIDGTAEMTKEIMPLVSKIIRLPQSKRIQDKMMKDRITEIDKEGDKLYSDSWGKLDSRSKAYIIIMQVAMDAYGEPNWLSSDGTNKIITGGAEKEANIDTYIADLSDFIKDIAKKKQKSYLEYVDWEAIASVNDVTDWKEFYSGLESVLNKTTISVKAIPDKDLSFGLGNGKKWVLPPGLGKTKSFMGNHKLTAEGTEQFRLKKFTTTGEHGLGMIDGRITVAMYAGAKGHPKGYGEIGDMIDIQLSTGQILHCVIGDAKAIEHDQRAGDKTNIKYGVHHDGSIVEFILNTQVAGEYPPRPWPSFTTIFPGEVRVIVNNGPIGK